ncbi:MAG: hypothetical protein H7070_15210 [Saprospiraceae bacterium]|nr:hypothetical protein [Pyrinomonadaceae bacterium]
MQKNTFTRQESIVPLGNSHQGVQSAAIMNNRVEALKALSNSLLSELEALRTSEYRDQAEKIDLANEVERFQVDLIRTALLRTGGRQRAAARLLNVKATTLHAKIRRYGLEANVVGSVED